MKGAAAKQEQFVTDMRGRKIAVILDLETYRRLLEAEEDLADIEAYDKAAPAVHASIGKGDFITLAEFKEKRRKR